ncbi:hypothetical protein Vretifemale_19806, partial [Volvox reticuliferus]
FDGLVTLLVDDYQCMIIDAHDMLALRIKLWSPDLVATLSFRFEALMHEEKMDRWWLWEDLMTDRDTEASRLVRDFMIKNVLDCHLPVLRAANSARQAWDALAAVFAASSDARKSQLIAELSSLRMGPGEVLPVYIARAHNLYTDLLQVGHITTEREVCFQLLNGLSKKFPMKVAILTHLVI